MNTTPATEQAAPDLPLPENFNLDEWISGVRSTVRSCTIYQRADLLAELEDLERRLQLVEAEDAEEFGIEDAADSAEALNARIDQVYKQLLDSAVTFKVEGRSADWLKAKEKEIVRHSMTHGTNDEQKAQVVTRHQLADAIIQPAGITAEHLEVLEEVAGAQYRRLVATFFAACSQAPTVSAPTSPSSSAKRGGRGR